MKAMLAAPAAGFALLVALAAPAALGAQDCRVCVPFGEGGDATGGPREGASGNQAEGGGGSAEELAALESTLTALGYDYVLTDDPASETCQVALSFPGCGGNCFGAPDISWVQAGNGFVQISDWGPGFQDNDYESIPEDTPVALAIVDAGHPITQGLPAGWTSLGFWHYDTGGSDYYGWVDDPDLNLATIEGVDRGLSARTEGAGRLVYIGWNVYGPDAEPEDLTILRQAIDWAGQCGYQAPLPQEIPTLAAAPLAALALLLGGAALLAFGRRRRSA